MSRRTERHTAVRGGARAGRLILVVLAALVIAGLFGFYSPIFL